MVRLRERPDHMLVQGSLLGRTVWGRHVWPRGPPRDSPDTETDAHQTQHKGAQQPRWRRPQGDEPGTAEEHSAAHAHAHAHSHHTRVGDNSVSSSRTGRTKRDVRAASTRPRDGTAPATEVSTPAPGAVGHGLRAGAGVSGVAGPSPCSGGGCEWRD